MIIGITGLAGSGKDTVADYLVKHKGYTKVSFAAPLKAMLAAGGLAEPANRDDKEKVAEGFDFTWREAAQTLGTEWGRSLDENIWVKMLINSLEVGKDYVISDVRFDNEAEAIRSASGSIIHLQGRKADLGNNASHASEQPVQMRTRDYCVSNNGTVEVLLAKIAYICKEGSL